MASSWRKLPEGLTILIDYVDCRDTRPAKADACVCVRLFLLYDIEVY
jgi:hypothetical protein